VVRLDPRRGLFLSAAWTDVNRRVVVIPPAVGNPDDVVTIAVAARTVKARIGIQRSVNGVVLYITVGVITVTAGGGELDGSIGLHFSGFGENADILEFLFHLFSNDINDIRGRGGAVRHSQPDDKGAGYIRRERGGQRIGAGKRRRAAFRPGVEGPAVSQRIAVRILGGSGQLDRCTDLDGLILSRIAGRGIIDFLTTVAADLDFLIPLPDLADVMTRPGKGGPGIGPREDIGQGKGAFRIKTVRR